MRTTNTNHKNKTTQQTKQTKQTKHNTTQTPVRPHTNTCSPSHEHLFAQTQTPVRPLNQISGTPTFGHGQGWLGRSAPYFSAGVFCLFCENGECWWFVDGVEYVVEFLDESVVFSEFVFVEVSVHASEVVECFVFDVL